jgi:hypothetical protein
LQRVNENLLSFVQSAIIWDLTRCTPEEHTGSSFTVRRICQISSMLDLLFDTEDGGNIYLQNVGKLVPEYVAAHNRRQYCSYVSSVRHFCVQTGYGAHEVSYPNRRMCGTDCAFLMPMLRLREALLSLLPYVFVGWCLGTEATFGTFYMIIVVPCNPVAPTFLSNVLPLSVWSKIS